MDRIELERKASELTKKYDKYSHMTENGKLYLIDIFLKKEMTIKEFDVPVVAFSCHDGKMLITDEDQDYCLSEDLCTESLKKFLDYISDENNIFNDYPNGFYNDKGRKLIVK